MKKQVITISLSFIAGLAVCYVVLSASGNKDTVPQVDRGGVVNKKYRTVSKDEPDLERGVYHGKSSINYNPFSGKFSHFSNEDFKSALTEVDGLPINEALLARVFLCSEWGRKDPEFALAYLHKKTKLTAHSGWPNELKEVIYSSWAESDPEAAAQNILGKEIGGWSGFIKFNSVKETIAQSWLRNDPDMALEYVKKTKDTTHPIFSLAEYFKGVYDHDSELALQQLDQFPQEEQKEGVVGIAELWGAKEEWNVVEAKISNLPNSIREAARYSAINALALEDLIEAKEVLKNLVIPEQEKDGILISIMNQQISEEPFAALEWASTDVSLNSHENLIDSFISSWKEEKGEWGTGMRMGMGNVSWANEIHISKSDMDKIVNAASESGDLSEVTLNTLKARLEEIVAEP